MSAVAARNAAAADRQNVSLAAGIRDRQTYNAPKSLPRREFCPIIRNIGVFP